MKKLGLLLLFSLCISAYAQLTQGFNYQAVARDADGEPMTGAVNVQFVIHQTAANGASVFEETHNNVPLNAFGLFSVVIGRNNAQAFGGIDWANGPFFLEVRVNGQALGPTTQFQAVPYSKWVTDMKIGGLIDVAGDQPQLGEVLKWNGEEWAPDVDNEGNGTGGPTYTAGNGIEINGTQIINTEPDQVVNLTGTGGTTVTGNYPNFTINSVPGEGETYTAGEGIQINNNNQIINTEPDQVVNLTGTGGTTVTGNYPNFTINSEAGEGTVYTAGNGIQINNNNQIINTEPDQEVKLTGTGGTTVTGTYPNFTINSEQGGGGGDYTAGEGIKIDNNVISNTAPDLDVDIFGQGTIKVDGDYPTYTLRSEDPDEDATNELQQLRINGNELSITNGNSVQLPTGGNGNSLWEQNGDEIYYDRGWVGVGVNNPDWTLHVIHPGGDARFGIGMENGGAIVQNQWHIHIADGRFDTHMVLRRNNRDKIKFTDDGTVIEVSDQRLKLPVSTLSSALPRILQLQPTTYVMNNPGASKKPVLGLMAQEVHRLFPEITDYNPGQDQYGIAYSRVGVLAIQAIKEQQEIIDEQRVEMETLKETLKAQQQLIQEMNARLIQIESTQSRASLR